jgi:hypothetical protein
MRPRASYVAGKIKEYWEDSRVARAVTIQMMQEDTCTRAMLRAVHVSNWMRQLTQAVDENYQLRLHMRTMLFTSQLGLCKD